MDPAYKEKKQKERSTVDDSFVYLDNKVGEGTYGVVYKARSKDPHNKREYALKKIKGTGMWIYIHQSKHLPLYIIIYYNYNYNYNYSHNHNSLMMIKNQLTFRQEYIYIYKYKF